MAYSDHTTRTPPNRATDPYGQPLPTDPALRSRRPGTVLAGLLVAVLLILGLIFGAGLLGSDDAAPPAAIENAETLPPGDAADAPVAATPPAEGGAVTSQ
ncbi:hypothetical protein [Roseivivax sp. CAU 1761]